MMSQMQKKSQIFLIVLNFFVYLRLMKLHNLYALDNLFGRLLNLHDVFEVFLCVCLYIYL